MSSTNSISSSQEVFKEQLFGPTTKRKAVEDDEVSSKVLKTVPVAFQQSPEQRDVVLRPSVEGARMRGNVMFVADKSGSGVFQKPPSSQRERHVLVEVLQSDSKVIDTRIFQGSTVFYITFVYGDPVRMREVVWERITRIGIQRDDPWLLTGDFNEIMDNSEKLGGPRRPESSFYPFRTMARSSRIIEIPSCGNSLSWGAQRDNVWVQCRLDGSFGNSGWFTLFPRANTEYLELMGSDHRPIITRLVGDDTKFRRRFIFDKRWISKPETTEIIREQWALEGANQSKSVLRGLARCRKALSRWKRTHPTNSATQIQLLRRDLEEEATKQSVQYKRLKNRLNSLVDKHGFECFEEGSKGNIAVEYFTELFKTFSPGNFEELLKGMALRVSDGMNQQLAAPVTAQEIKQAAFNIKGDSAPGADGWIGAFFRRYWSIVGDDIVKEIQYFFEDGVFPQDWNHTQICLTPKKDNANQMRDMRPISLCSVLYKIVSKVLCTRLKKCLPTLVSETQGAFVSGRQISDNILIAHEMVHALRTHAKFNSGFVAIKTDMSKAYDRVEWEFLEHLLIRMGLLVCRATKEECEELLACLQLYGEASGQQINFEKSAVTFGSKTLVSSKLMIKQTLGITTEGGEGNYLGLPECFIGSKQALLALIGDKLKKRLQGWFAKTLSLGGKEILLKSIALALLVYAMSCFRLSKHLYRKLTSAMRDFRWNSCQGNRKISWVAWSEMCKSKADGGLGFKDLGDFNQALLAKQAWRILNNPESLVSRFYKSRYFRKSTIMECGSGSRPYYAWRSILHGHNLLKQGLMKMIGNGMDTFVWKEKWIFDKHPRAPYRMDTFFNVNLKVVELHSQVDGQWDIKKITALFPPDDAKQILAMKIAATKRNRYIWPYMPSGAYSVKIGYWLLRTLPSISEPRSEDRIKLTSMKAKVWKLQTVPKIRTFLWRMLSGDLTVSERLASHGLIVDTRCSICGHQEETICHMLFSCAVARQACGVANIPLPSRGFSDSDLVGNWEHLLTVKQDKWVPEEIRNMILWLLWELWKWRNIFLFQGKQGDIRELVDKAFTHSSHWFAAQAL
ncbi:PREDICTED: uncharacterized protein LOC109132435 [Camelina sativa]|uniref:Uncharacterized protein LOC109132435 n=1 Tax=Camelina sativa TaxID=90675 RepID=A0ABM1RKQ0_CAMSA|nr:PREDICTED: uncharacterized protein LOC109132435 [Camelina sativa]